MFPQNRTHPHSPAPFTNGPSPSPVPNDSKPGARVAHSLSDLELYAHKGSPSVGAQSRTGPVSPNMGLNTIPYQLATKHYAFPRQPASMAPQQPSSNPAPTVGGFNRDPVYQPQYAWRSEDIYMNNGTPYAKRNYSNPPHSGQTHPQLFPGLFNRTQVRVDRSSLTSNQGPNNTRMANTTATAPTYSVPPHNSPNSGSQIPTMSQQGPRQPVQSGQERPQPRLAVSQLPPKSVYTLYTHKDRKFVHQEQSSLLSKRIQDYKNAMSKTLSNDNDLTPIIVSEPEQLQQPRPEPELQRQQPQQPQQRQPQPQRSQPQAQPQAPPQAPPQAQPQTQPKHQQRQPDPQSQPRPQKPQAVPQLAATVYQPTAPQNITHTVPDKPQVESTERSNSAMTSIQIINKQARALASQVAPSATNKRVPERPPGNQLSDGDKSPLTVGKENEQIKTRKPAIERSLKADSSIVLPERTGVTGDGSTVDSGNKSPEPAPEPVAEPSPGRRQRSHDVEMESPNIKRLKSVGLLGILLNPVEFEFKSLNKMVDSMSLESPASRKNQQNPI